MRAKSNEATGRWREVEAEDEEGVVQPHPKATMIITSTANNFRIAMEIARQLRGVEHVPAGRGRSPIQAAPSSTLVLMVHSCACAFMERCLELTNVEPSTRAGSNTGFRSRAGCNVLFSPPNLYENTLHPIALISRVRLADSRSGQSSMTISIAGRKNFRCRANCPEPLAHVMVLVRLVHNFGNEFARPVARLLASGQNHAMKRDPTNRPRGRLTERTEMNQA